MNVNEFVCKYFEAKNLKKYEEKIRKGIWKKKRKESVAFNDISNNV